jgi:hypothetical protein
MRQTTNVFGTDLKIRYRLAHPYSAADRSIVCCSIFPANFSHFATALIFWFFFIKKKERRQYSIPLLIFRMLRFMKSFTL